MNDHERKTKELNQLRDAAFELCHVLFGVITTTHLLGIILAKSDTPHKKGASLLSVNARKTLSDAEDAITDYRNLVLEYWHDIDEQISNIAPKEEIPF